MDDHDDLCDFQRNALYLLDAYPQDKILRFFLKLIAHYPIPYVTSRSIILLCNNTNLLTEPHWSLSLFYLVGAVGALLRSSTMSALSDLFSSFVCCFIFSSWDADCLGSEWMDDSSFLFCSSFRMSFFPCYDLA